ncbi:hypothetical protein BpHYR1_041284 [Brachionus plicatilis]|uniref:Uncharacterized protein n=1 Tax=Brachionus plicatilis TaxID=10195 RepID=A0A3M7PPD4_BRAPC|nr:hypothetical protein BpHYR1_041284 [Brachionus plicatilis]
MTILLTAPKKVKKDVSFFNFHNYYSFFIFMLYFYFFNLIAAIVQLRSRSHLTDMETSYWKCLEKK